MQKFQLEPLKLKTLPIEAPASPFPFSELGVPISRLASGTTDRVNELERMLAEAQDRMAVLEREAYDKAYATGERAGMELGRKRAEQILAAMQQALTQTSEQLDDIHRHMSEAVVDIAGSLTEWLVGNLVTEDHTRLLAMAERMSAALPTVSAPRLAVHPDDLEKFERLMEGSNSPWSLLSDIALTPGTIRIFNKEQDILIDPHAMIADAVAQLKKELLAGDATNTTQAVE